MKVEITETRIAEAKYLSVEAFVRYWEDATINGVDDTEGNLTPCRKGDLWCPNIDIDSGKILNWEVGKEADIHFKVCDRGSYYIKDADGNVLLKREREYVPSIMYPEENGFGDYIIMKIDKDGQIKNWNPVIEGGFESD